MENKIDKYNKLIMLLKEKKINLNKANTQVVDLYNIIDKIEDELYILSKEIDDNKIVKSCVICVYYRNQNKPKDICLECNKPSSIHYHIKPYQQ